MSSRVAISHFVGGEMRRSTPQVGDGVPSAPYELAVWSCRIVERMKKITATKMVLGHNHQMEVA